jgi:hypothetical protein
VTTSEAQAAVYTLKLALVAPAATVTGVGTVAAARSLLESATAAPSAGAAALRVTVPIESVPPGTLVGLRLKEERVAGVGVTRSQVPLVSPPLAPEIATYVEFVTGLVVTAKFALVAPAGTVTLAGTVATAGLLLESAITAPPSGAGAGPRFTVPVDGVPPTTLAGSRLMKPRVNGPYT